MTRFVLAVAVTGVASAVVMFLWMLVESELFVPRSMFDEPIMFAGAALLFWLPMACAWTGAVTNKMARSLVKNGDATLGRLMVRSTLPVAALPLLIVVVNLVGGLAGNDDRFLSDLPAALFRVAGWLLAAAAATNVYWLILDPPTYFRPTTE